MRSFLTRNLHGIGIVFVRQTVSSIPHLIEKDMVREYISKMKNVKAAGPSGVVSEMIKAAREAKVDMITDMKNYIIVRVIV